jgi:hypothetical protein
MSLIYNNNLDVAFVNGFGNLNEFPTAFHLTVQLEIIDVFVPPGWFLGILFTH